MQSRLHARHGLKGRDCFADGCFCRRSDWSDIKDVHVSITNDDFVGPIGVIIIRTVALAYILAKECMRQNASINGDEKLAIVASPLVTPRFCSQQEKVITLRYDKCFVQKFLM